MQAAGRLVTIEGIDGAGKSVQAETLARRLVAAGHDAIATREPGGGAGGGAIRSLLVGNSAGTYSGDTELLLFLAARRNHLDTLIQPALDAGRLVICDRYADSTRVYQGLNNPERRHLINQLHRLVIDREPDLTFILDLPVEDAISRIRSRSGHDPRFENLGEQVGLLREEFCKLCQEYPGRCVLVDGARPRDAIADEILARTIGMVDG